MECNQPPVLQNLEMNFFPVAFPVFFVPFLDLFIKPGQVAVTPACIGHDIIDVITMLANDGVVDYPAVLV